MPISALYYGGRPVRFRDTAHAEQEVRRALDLYLLYGARTAAQLTSKSASAIKRWAAEARLTIPAGIVAGASHLDLTVPRYRELRRRARALYSQNDLTTDEVGAVLQVEFGLEHPLRGSNVAKMVDVRSVSEARALAVLSPKRKKGRERIRRVNALGRDMAAARAARRPDWAKGPADAHGVHVHTAYRWWRDPANAYGPNYDPVAAGYDREDGDDE